MRRPELVVFTEAFDPHVDHVAPALARRGVDWWRVSLHRFPLEMKISHEIGGEPLCVIEDDTGTIDLSGARAVWYRRTPRPMLAPDLPREQRALARGESHDFLDGLWSVLAGRRWISYPWATRRAGSKAGQLARAAALGLPIPRTLCSNDPTAVRGFYAACGGSGSVIYKTHQPILVPAEDPATCAVVYTSLLEDAHLDRLDEIACSPGIFQQYVAKDHEIRVTVIGKRLFACRIFSQERESSRVDWRNWDWAQPGATLPRHEPCELPEPIADAVLALVEGYDLSFATVDLIVTPEGGWVFLEMNPNGQWAWVETLTGLPLTEALVQELLTNPEVVR